MNIDVELLRSNPILASLDQEILAKLAETAEYIHFGQGQGFATGMDTGDEIYLIIEGQAQIQIALNLPGHPNDTIIYSPGDLVAALRFFEVPFPADAVVNNTEIRAIYWHTRDLRTICEQDFETGYQLATKLGKLVLKRTKAISNNPNF